jgi:hypothetical protein
MALYRRVIAPKVAAGFAAALVISMSSGSRSGSPVFGSTLSPN